MAPTAALLERSVAWPERDLAEGDVVLAEGETAGSLHLLLTGRLLVRRGAEALAVIDEPGACIGEMALLLGRPHTATVVALEPSRIRTLPDAAEALHSSPDLLVPVAQILASRLHLVTAYLADLRHQYADTGHGLGLVSDVLGHLVQHHGAPVEPGSEREPDAPY
jgi:CRP-like cAMP-binding protein